jgi:hypothetical protein
MIKEVDPNHYSWPNSLLVANFSEEVIPLFDLPFVLFFRLREKAFHRTQDPATLVRHDHDVFGGVEAGCRKGERMPDGGSMNPPMRRSFFPPWVCFDVSYGQVMHEPPVPSALGPVLDCRLVREVGLPDRIRLLSY